MGKSPNKPIIFITITLLVMILFGGAWNISSRLFLPKDTLDSLLQHGIRAYRQGEIDQAFLRFQQAASKSPKDPTVHYLLAQSLETMGREDEAITHYQKALELNPRLPEPRYNLAIIYNRRKDYPAAAAELKTALTIRPDFHGARYALGGIYIELEAYQSAVTELEKLTTADLERSLKISSHNLLGKAYLALDDIAKARQQWQAVLRLDHTNIEAQEQLEQLRESAP